MSKINPKKAYVKEILDRFEGIGEALSAEQMKTASILNFRILADGSLEKRNGWKTHLSLDGEEIRGVWQGSLNGESLCVVVAQEDIFTVDENGARVTAPLSSSILDNVSLFAYRNRLYLLDGKSIRVWNSELRRFEEAQGYAPLIGIGWHPRTMGAEHEPLNLLCNRARVHYSNTSGETVFHLPLMASGIDSVKVNGVTTKDYVIHSPSNQITVNTVGTSVEIAFHFQSATLHDELLQHSTLFFTDFFGEREKLLLGGSEKGQLVYSALEVTDTMLTSCAGIYPDVDPLYFSSNSILIVGDTNHPVTAFFRDYDRVLATSTLALHSISLSAEDDAMETHPIRSGMGSLCKGPGVSANGDPIVLNENGVFRLHAPANDPDNFIATRISALIPELSERGFAENAILCFDSIHNELWIRNRAASDSVVWVYGLTTKQWYCFDGIPANLFFYLDGKLGFAKDNQVCLFDDALTTDGGALFISTYETSYLSFSEPELPKRGLRASIKAEPHGNQLSLWLESEVRRRIIPIGSATGAAPTLFDRRAALGRFHFLRATIRDRGTERSRIYRLALYANL